MWSFRVLAVLGCVDDERAAFTCTGQWANKVGTPKCAGAMSSTCVESSCCDAQPVCADKQGAWLLAQALGSGCRKDSAAEFWDLEKTAVVLPASATDAQIKANCCTPTSEAQCSDWKLSTCSTGKVLKIGSHDAPADSGTPMRIITQSSFNDKCCEVPPVTCADKQGAWLFAQVGGGGCHLPIKTAEFWDTEKTAVVLPTSATRAQIKDKCCTLTSKAQCSDWTSSICPTGTQRKTGSHDAPADSGDTMLAITQSSFNDKCCEVTCAHKQGAWLLAQGIGGGCAENSAAEFWDLKKTAVVLPTSPTVAQIKANCCTPSSEAQCSDWSLKTCATGTHITGTRAAPANSGTPVRDLTQVKFREVCCRAPMTCAEYDVVNAAGSRGLAVWVSFVLAGVFATGLQY